MLKGANRMPGYWTIRQHTAAAIEDGMVSHRLSGAH